MAKLNARAVSVKARTHEGAVVTKNSSPLQELRRTVLTCLLWENTFYEKGSDVAGRIAELCEKVEATDIAELAVEARNEMQLRHVPLFLAAQLTRKKGQGTLVAEVLANIVQRPDELGEFLKIYWSHGARNAGGKKATNGKHPVAAGVKRGLAEAFRKFSGYQLAKWNRDGEIKLRDVLRIVHPKPVSLGQAKLWESVITGTIEAPDTWEVALSAGKDKKETFTRLIQEGKLGGMALLMNLRGMLEAGVDKLLIEERLQAGCGRALPFRFLTAARYAPGLEDALGTAMMKGLESEGKIAGITGLLVDVSGSMDATLSGKGETTRLDAANGLAIILRERCEHVEIGTFSDSLVNVPPRRGFALRDAIMKSQPHGSTYLAKAVNYAAKHWKGIDRLIVITDEQSHDGEPIAFAGRNYIINVATYKHGVSNAKGWEGINGWSDKVVDYIVELEKELDRQDVPW